MRAASAAAVKSGQPVAVDSLTTPTELIAASPKGGFHLTSNVEPVRTRQHGTWRPVNLRLRQNTDGTWSPEATAYGAVSFSGGGGGTLLTTESGTVSVAVSWPGSLPAPVVNGATATYRNVLPSVDLVLSATASGGYSDTLVVKSATAAKNGKLASLQLATRVQGGRLAEGRDGALAVLDAHGRPAATAATPLMWDSNLTLPKIKSPHASAAGRASASPIGPDASDTSHPGLAARTAVVSTSVSKSALVLTPDSRMLTAHSTVFPVYIDPTFSWHPYDPAAPNFDEVKQGCPGVSFYNQTGSLADNGYLGVGYNAWPEGNCNTGDEHAVYQWKLSSTIWDAQINSATVEATEAYSASCGSGTYTVNLHWSGGIGSGTDWSNRPGNLKYSTSMGFPRAYNPTYCPSNGTVSEGFDVATPIRTLVSEHGTSFAGTVSEDAAEGRYDSSGFSRFTHNPALQIFYNISPSAPTAATMSAVSGSDNAACDTSAPYPYMGKTISSTPPVLKAKVSDPDGDKLQATFQYWIDGSSSRSTGNSPDNLASGSYATFSLPSSFVGSLTNGQVVDWQVSITDGEATTPYSKSPTCHFTAEPSAPDAPTITSENNLYPDTENGGGPGAAANTPGKFDLSTTGGASATEFVYNLDVAPPTVNPPADEVVTATNNAATITVTPPSPGPHVLWVYAVDAAGDVSGTPGYNFLATGDTGSSCSSLSTCMNNTAISPDSNMSLGAADGSASFSATDLTNAGWTSGGKVTIDGATFTLPAFGTGQKDNVLAANQTVTYTGSGNALVFLTTSTNANLSDSGAISGDTTAPYVPAGTGVSGSYCFSGTNPVGVCPATGTITYTDGTSTSYDLTVPDWIGGPVSLAAVALPHWNKPSGQVNNSAYQPKIFPFAVPIDPAKTIASVTLPDVSTKVGNGTPALHVFGLATRNTAAGTPEANGTTAAAASGQSWTGAWANANEGQYNFQGSNFSNQTFRIALKPSISGGTVRVKLDNALGTSSLTIGHATIAADSGSGSPSAIPAAAPTTLKFGGSQSVTIPEGGMVYSDPLPFTVTAGQYLLVSYQLSNSVPYLVQHSYANNAYEYLTAVGSGDKTTDTTGTPFTGTGTDQGWFSDLATNLDVSTAGIPTQAVLGDGLIDPFQPNTTPTNSSGYRVSDTLAGAEPTTPSPYGTIAEGIESNQLMTDNPGTLNGGAIGGPSVLSRIDRDILDQPSINNVIVYEGLEDLLHGRVDTDLTANGYTTLLQQLQGWGITPTLTSLTPCDGFAGDGATSDSCSTGIDGYRTNVNGWLSTAQNPYDPNYPIYFADFNAAISVPDTTNGEEKLSPQADAGDHVNIANAGYAAETAAILSSHDTWALNDGTGYTVANDTAPTDTPYAIKDTTGVGENPLTLNGTTTWTNDATRGEVLTFDGSSGYAASSGQVLNTAGSYSVSAWVDISSLPSRNAIIASQDGSQQGAFALMYDYTHASQPGWGFIFPTSDAASPSYKTSYSSGATANTWTHLVGVYNAATQTAQLYVNGSLAGTATGVTSWSATGAFTVGRGKYNGNNDSPFPGAVSNVQAWNYALTPNQVTALYQQIQ